MVSTRKKDYGAPRPPKKKRTLPKKKRVPPPPKKKGVPPKVTEDGDPKRPKITEQTACTKFTLFPKLPPELRIEIWKLSITPRLVVVQPKVVAKRRLFKFNKKMFPAHLSVNCEAREIAQRHYTLRFTITVTVDTTGQHNWDCPNFESTRYHANVVMSPDDTLGFLGWEDIPLEFGWKFHVESADWNQDHWAHTGARLCGAHVQPQVTKVAVLTHGSQSSPKVINALNSSTSWDLRPILHTKSDKLRKILPPHGSPAHPTRGPSDFQNHILIHSRNFNGTLQQWGVRLMYRSQLKGLPRQGLPDILAFELGRQPDPQAIPGLAAPGQKLWEPEDLYFWHEWRWLRRHPCSRGF